MSGQGRLHNGFRLRRLRDALGRGQHILVTTSPLRPFDPRAKLALCLCFSLAAMLPLQWLAVCLAIYALLVAWARLLPHAARQLWSMKWLLLALFGVNWLVVGIELAATVTLRVMLLAGVFALFVHTTSTGELRLALERLGVPYRYAFSLSLAFQSVDLLKEEWQSIREAQQARGVGTLRWRGWRNLGTEVRALVALTVPVVVLVTRRAWAVTEAAYARGFDAPHRRPYRRLTMQTRDWALIGMTVLGLIGLFWAPQLDDGGDMTQRFRILIAVLILVLLVGGVLAVEALRRQRQSATQLEPGSIPIYVNEHLAGGFVPADLEKLEQASFVDAEEGKPQEGWRLNDVLLLYVPEDQLRPDTQVTIISSSRNKSADLTWNEIEDPENMVMFDLSSRGTLKLVSLLERLDTRDEWIQDVDQIKIH